MLTKWFVYFFVILLYVTPAFCQDEHLNRSDSGKVLSYLDAYNKSMALNDSKEASRAMDEIAYIYWTKNLSCTAISYYERSLVLNGNIENDNGIAMIHNNLGMLYNDVADYEKSLYHFKLTLSARRAKNEPVGIISALVNMSVVSNNLKQYAESINYLQEALSLSRQINDPQQMSSVYAMLSETYEKKGDVDESMRYFQLFKSYHDLLQKKEISKLSGDIVQDSLEKQVKELELQKKAFEVKEKQYQLDSSFIINKGLDSNLTSKEGQIRLMQIEDSVQAEKAVIALERDKAVIAAKNHLRDILILIAISLLLLGASLLVYNRKMAAKNLRLAEQNAAIEKQKEELLESNEVKNKIFSIIAHDLRSPLNAVQSFFNVLHLYDVDDEIKMLFGKMERDLNALSGVLDTLLNWAKSQLQELKPELKPVEVWEAANENIELLTPVAEQKKVKLLNNVPSELLAVTDMDLTKIIIRNLVQNALKFTKAGGSVSITGKKENGSAFLTVSDTGVGMNQAKIESLFSFKSNQSTLGTSKEKGTGLGLVLCSELLKLCEGEILVNSEINKGTQITLKFNTPV